MGAYVEIITPLHKRTSRDYAGRMMDQKIECMETAKKYGQDYWDGPRRYGYGGYTYDGRWNIVAEKLARLYKLPSDARILDVGCGKGFLLYEFKKILPNSTVVGIDISDYALAHAKEEVRPFVRIHKAEAAYPFTDKQFDLVVSITTLHNLRIFDLKTALQEIERVGKHKYLAVESYRNSAELFNLQCWALTCQAFFSREEWEWLFREFGYTGDYEFIYFE